MLFAKVAPSAELRVKAEHIKQSSDDGGGADDSAAQSACREPRLRAEKQRHAATVDERHLGHVDRHVGQRGFGDCSEERANVVRGQRAQSPVTSTMVVS